MLLALVMPGGLGKMKRWNCGGEERVTPDRMKGLVYSTHDQVICEIEPAGIQLLKAVNDCPRSVSPMSMIGARRTAVLLRSPRRMTPSGVTATAPVAAAPGSSECPNRKLAEAKRSNLCNPS